MAQKLLLIVGPTAVGKTTLAVELAQKFNGEVISGDSMQIYRGLDIGTAKVTPAEMQDIKHYMLDINEIDQRFSVADFIAQCKQDAQMIAKEDKLPILAGGTGFYLHALLNDFKLGQDSYAQAEITRNKWHAFAAEHGQKKLWEKLAQIDPKAATKIPFQNEQRVVRALEVYEKTGNLFSSQADQKSLAYDALIIGLTTERALLYERINQRVDLMLEQGLLAEARFLYEKGGVQLPPGKGIGYKEFYPYFEDKITLEEAVLAVKQNSRRYAKRQLTWFRNKMDVNWFDIVQHPAQKEKIIELVTDWLAK
jgi:tRNA dimethylallyltransferase